MVKLILKLPRKSVSHSDSHVHTMLSMVGFQFDRKMSKHHKTRVRSFPSGEKAEGRFILYFMVNLWVNTTYLIYMI